MINRSAGPEIIRLIDLLAKLPGLGPRSAPEALDGTNSLNGMNFLDEMDTTHRSAGHPQTARVRHAARKMIDVRFERSRIASLRGA